jgi:hypothetical protein
MIAVDLSCTHLNVIAVPCHPRLACPLTDRWIRSLYPIAIQVPSNIANGDWPLVTNIGGVQSPNDIVLTVQQ